MPILVAGHSPRTRLQPRLHPQEPLASSRAGANPPPVGADKNPLQARANGRPPPARAEWPKPPSKVESQPPRERTSPPGPQEVLPTTPPGRGGAGDGAGTNWYQMYMCETQGGYLNPQGLCTRWGWWRRGKRPLDTSTIGWPENNHPSIT